MFFILWNLSHNAKLSRALVVLRQNSVLLGETSNAIVGFTHSSDFSADGIGFHGVQHASGVAVNLNQVDLNRGMILSVDDSVTGRAVINNNKDLRLYYFDDVKSLSANTIADPRLLIVPDCNILIKIIYQNS
jgi:hypothetical protein